MPGLRNPRTPSRFVASLAAFSGFCAVVGACTTSPCDAPHDAAAAVDAVMLDVARADASDATMPGDALVGDAGPLDAPAIGDLPIPMDVPSTMDGAAPFDVPIALDAPAALDVPGVDVAAQTDAASTADASSTDAPAPDAPMGPCRMPVVGAAAACIAVSQSGPQVVEQRVAAAPPTPTAGWYPGGIFVLTASTLYTGPGGAEGPTGITYAATMHVRGTGSVDLFDVVQSQPGCADVGYVFSGDTFEAVTSLHDVAWMCPTCPTCGPTLGYSGTLTTFVVYFPQPDGSTLVQEFTQGPH